MGNQESSSVKSDAQIAAAIDGLTAHLSNEDDSESRSTVKQAIQSCVDRTMTKFEKFSTELTPERALEMSTYLRVLLNRFAKENPMPPKVNRVLKELEEEVFK